MLTENEIINTTLKHVNDINNVIFELEHNSASVEAFQDSLKDLLTHSFEVIVDCTKESQKYVDTGKGVDKRLIELADRAVKHYVYRETLCQYLDRVYKIKMN